MNYEQSLDWLALLASEKKFFSGKQLPSLKTVNKALDLLGRPDETFKMRVVIGGTAGKGTTCRYIEQTLINEGKSVALISSPHLQIVNERIRLNGRLVSASDFVFGICKIKVLCEKESLDLTYYEVIVLAGIYLAAEQQIEILICEVGIGGALDAVNAVRGPRVAAVTFVGNDHLEMFAGSIENLAVAKAGVFTLDSILNLTYEQKYCSIFNENSKCKIVYLKGLKQKLNKKLARKVCEQILGSKSFVMTTERLPARWERVGEGIVLDGAHSAPRFEYLIATKLKKNKGPYTLVLGMQKNHNPKALKLLLPYTERFILTESGQNSALPAEDLKKVLGGGELVKNPLEAFKRAQQFKEKVLIVGSFYLCGVLREKFYSSQKILEQQTEWPE